MTPEEFLQKEFKDEEFLVNPTLENEPIMSVNTCRMLMEMYHRNEMNRIIEEFKSPSEK